MVVSEVELIRRQARAWDLDLDDSKVGSLLDYAAFIRDYKEANVVGTRNVSRFVVDHLLDSLSCLLYEPVRQAESLIDVGSGGGLPGIPLKIACSELYVKLVEATGKKTRFMEQAVGELSLNNVEVVNGRAENLGRDPAYRDSSDVATARALASLSTLCEYCIPLVKKGGHLLAMKALPDKEEVEAGKRAAETLGAEITDFVRVELLPELPSKHRCLVIVKKATETPSKYPRRPGVPKKDSLGTR